MPKTKKRIMEEHGLDEDDAEKVQEIMEEEGIGEELIGIRGSELKYL